MSLNTPSLQDAVATKPKPADAKPPAKRVAMVFPGQGSQSVGMLSELSEQFPIITETFTQASDVLGFDLWEICQDEGRLSQTDNTQPALLTASMAIWRLLTDVVEMDFEPLYLAGHSLGEYSALCASGAIGFDDAIRLVHTRGQAMQSAVLGLDTKMAAILGLEDEQVIGLANQVQDELSGVIVSPANFNSPGQVVIAGESRGIDALIAHVKNMGKRAIPLKVSVPSHCKLMDSAATVLAQKLANISLTTPNIPIIQNRNAQIQKSGALIKEALVEQVSYPVLWRQTMQSLADKQISLLIECGAGTVLSNLAKRQQNPISTYPTDKPARLTKLIEALS